MDRSTDSFSPNKDRLDRLSMTLYGIQDSIETDRVGRLDHLEHRIHALTNNLNEFESQNNKKCQALKDHLTTLFRTMEEEHS